MISNSWIKVIETFGMNEWKYQRPLFRVSGKVEHSMQNTSCNAQYYLYTVSFQWFHLFAPSSCLIPNKVINAVPWFPRKLFKQVCWFHNANNASLLFHCSGNSNTSVLWNTGAKWEWELVTDAQTLHWDLEKVLESGESNIVLYSLQMFCFQFECREGC